MKPLFLLILISMISFKANALEVIRINQLGYLPNSIKVAVFFSDGIEPYSKFQLVEAASGKKVFEGKPQAADAKVWGQATALRLDFSSVKQSGEFQLKVGKCVSPAFKIERDVYKGTADFILHYMRQQRCGFNPYLKDSCHLHDGIIVDHPTRSGQRIDVTGGWHDATDYLQYSTTSINAVYQMLFAYQQNPQAYGDHYLANGLKGANGIPDILDEARWGLEWMLKMNPGENEMYNQIADDRDHRGFRLPNKDTVSYGLGPLFRPVYFVTGNFQGLGQHKNRTTGVSSIAAKFSSSFALASRIFKEIEPDFAALLERKSTQAWRFAKSDLGNCQTACVVSPYFYEEDNYVDDMELAAATLMGKDQKVDFLKEAKYWGELEPVTPWMELNRARHYQFYPFVNLGHALLAQSADTLVAKQFTVLMKQGLDDIKKRAENDPFLIGVPFIWCSNNLMAGAITQARLYRKITGDTRYEEMEAAMTDWLFGCNPWGTSMICGLPVDGDHPVSPHSSLTYILKENTIGGLVDGPVYAHIYQSLIGIRLMEDDEYAPFQGGKAVYHDDIGDFSTNEPTMDGTASLSYLLSSLEMEGAGVKMMNEKKKEQ